MSDDLNQALSGPTTAQLLTAVTTLLRRFVILPSDASYLALALFVLHTWAFDAAYATPYIVIESPEKQSGKTRLLEVLALVCRDPHKVASITAAALFQTVAQGHPTLLIDEADAIFASNGDRNEDLRGVLNAGNLPGSPVIRGGRNGEPVRYDVFCPKVIAGIATGRLPDTVRDRSIIISIDRKLRSEAVERLRHHRLKPEVDALRADLHAWAEEHQDKLREYDLLAPLEQISDRLEEAWEPLLAIADLAGGDCSALARAAALDLAGEGDDDATAAHTLLVALHGLFGDEDRLPSAVIVVTLNRDDSLPFGAWSDGKGLTQNGLARLLKRYRIAPKKIRVGKNATAQGYLREWFEPAWERYGGVSTGPPGTSQQPRSFSGDWQPEHDAECSTCGEGENAQPEWDVPAVPLQTGGTATERANGASATAEEEAFVERILAEHGDGEKAS